MLSKLEHGTCGEETGTSISLWPTGGPAAEKTEVPLQLPIWVWKRSHTVYLWVLPAEVQLSSCEAKASGSKLG